VYEGKLALAQSDLRNANAASAAFFQENLAVTQCYAENHSYVKVWAGYL